MEPISSFTEVAKRYVPENLPTFDRIVTVARKEFDRRAPPALKKVFLYKTEACLIAFCTLLFVAYTRNRAKQISAPSPPTKKQHPPPNSDSEDEIDIEKITDDHSEGSPRPKQPTEESLFIQLSEYENRSCSREEVEESLRQVRQMGSEQLVQQFNKIIARIDRAEKSEIAIKYGSVSQHSPSVEAIVTDPCRFCAYLFIERLIQLEDVNMIDSNWIDQTVFDGTNQKNTIGPGTCYDDDVVCFYRDNKIPTAIERETFNPDNHLVTNDWEWLKAQNPDLHDTPISVYNLYLEQWLNENNMGVTITVHNRTFAVVRRENTYYLFDSHGAILSLNRTEAFVATFPNARDLAEFLGEAHYPPNPTENTRKIIQFELDYAGTTYEEINGQFSEIFGQSIAKPIFDNFLKENDLSAPLIKAKLARIILDEPDELIEVIAFKRKSDGGKKDRACVD